MTEFIPFLQMFSKYVPQEQLQSILEQTQICNAELDMEARAILLEVTCPEYVSRRELEGICQELQGYYDVRRVEIFPHFPSEDLTKIEPEELMQFFVDQDSRARGSLAGCKWSWEGETLRMELVGNGKKDLESAVPSLRRYISDRFDRKISVEIQANQELHGTELFQKMEQMRQEMVSNLPKVEAPVQHKERPQNSVGKTVSAPAGADTIFGKPFVDRTIPIKEVTLDLRTVCVAGRVFSVDHKELTKNNAIVVNFDITDYTSSIRINRYFRERDLQKAQAIVDACTEGTWIKILAKPIINRFDNEMVLDPIAIMPHTAPKRLDTATDKRVELHLHTNMSNMDALTQATP